MKISKLTAVLLIFIMILILLRGSDLRPVVELPQGIPAASTMPPATAETALTPESAPEPTYEPKSTTKPTPKPTPKSKPQLTSEPTPTSTPKPTATVEPDITAEPTATPEATHNTNRITLEQFNKIKIDMNYDNVCKALGGNGELISEREEKHAIVNADGARMVIVFTIETYRWEGKASGSFATVVFKDGAVCAMAQSGLE